MKPALHLTICLLTVGCVNTSVHQLDQTPRAARARDAVVVLSDAPDQPHTVVAVVSARTVTVFDSFDDLRRALIGKAALLGGDAVILGPESRSATPIFNTIGFVMSEQKSMVGQVITFPPR